ncbi:hypothetical protein FHETE_9365 [Fusarium heterosporum]|uniref:Uncharacterized protein n=1 Tax=Fusarium heterosporum TaxID=42747 RepID=A0A8H5WGX5_FUSHE|nr:hypothetical protein FHETE_9365 [Fusarium heterosporum]
MFRHPPTPIFAAGDIAELVRLGHLTALGEDGTRKLHKRRLNPFADREYSDRSLEARSTTDPDAFVAIPDQRISKATIKYIGFKQEKADRIWYQWENWPAMEFPHKLEWAFLDYVLEYIDCSRDVYEEEDSAWRDAMDSWGISLDLQDAILDPLFKEIREADTCAEWVKDSMRMRFRGLEVIRKTSQDREKALLDCRSQPGVTNIASDD